MALAPPGAENPSPAFLAGQQHGAQLAVQHAARPAPAKPAAPARAAAPATLNGVLAQAQTLAGADTRAQINTLKAQQALYNQQAQQRAQQISLASQAAAKLLAGVGDQTAASYQNAAQVLAGIAGGYAGDLRSTATDAASQIQAQLAQLGAPAGSLKTAAGQTPQPQALSNVLYGLGGAIPANLLVTSGQAAAAAQRGLPASTLGYGSQQALGALSAGQQQAQALTAQILAARAGQPKLAQQYLASLQSQISQQQAADALSAYRGGQLKVSGYNAATSRINAQTSQLNSQIQKYNAYTSRLRAQNAGSTQGTGGSKPSSSITRTINDGYLHSADGQRVVMDGKPVPVAKTRTPGAGGPTVTQTRNSAEALGSARYYHQPWKDKAGNTRTPLSWQEYLTAGQQRGIDTAILIKQGRKVYTWAEIHQARIPGTKYPGSG